MATQLELEPAVRRRGPASAELATRAKALARATLLWIPVWVPLVFLGQLLVLGLRPTLAESARLRRAEDEVRARATVLRTEEGVLAEEARMLEDEVYRERVRRSLLDPAGTPLTLERARAGRP